MTRKESFETTRKTFCRQVENLPEACRNYFLLNLMISVLVAGFILIPLLMGDGPEPFSLLIGMIGMILSLFFTLQIFGLLGAAKQLARSYHGFMSGEDVKKLISNLEKPLSPAGIKPLTIHRILLIEVFLWMYFPFLYGVLALVSGIMVALNGVVIGGIYFRHFHNSA